MLPTPVATDANGARNSTATRTPKASPAHSGDTLTDAMWKLFPTPAARDGKGPNPNKREGGMDLPGAVALLPTPLTTDSQGGGHHGDGGMDLRTTATHLYGTAEWGKFEPAIRRWEGIVGREVPTPTEPNKNGNPRLNAAFSEWMMGWEEGWVTDLIEPSGRRAPEGKISRTAAMKIIGNGVVVQQAAAAIRDLLA
ncbi:DNA methylase [Mycobacterium phage Stasia]|uniref:DNA methylase n=1 Tax=Mycobacterium phage Stasia TaxID=1897548 RepID=A0A1D8EUL4_9CAUD|nr:DNA methyltransferase [Mycobacterium phage Stasia]AOT24731.1 DNA methylase [Mycobacterium phage Stasia]